MRPCVGASSVGTHAELESEPIACRPNIWPEKHLPQLRPVFQALGQRVAVVGELIAALCDEYMQQKVHPLQLASSHAPHGTLTVLPIILASTLHASSLQNSLGLLPQAQDAAQTHTPLLYPDNLHVRLLQGRLITCEHSSAMLLLEGYR